MLPPDAGGGNTGWRGGDEGSRLPVPGNGPRQRRTCAAPSRPPAVRKGGGHRPSVRSANLCGTRPRAARRRERSGRPYRLLFSSIKRATAPVVAQRRPVSAGRPQRGCQSGPGRRAVSANACGSENRPRACFACRPKRSRYGGASQLGRPVCGRTARRRDVACHKCTDYFQKPKAKGRQKWPMGRKWAPGCCRYGP